MEAVSIHTIGHFFRGLQILPTEQKKKFMEIIFINLYTLVVHAITLYNTHLLIIVCATCGDMMNSWKILYSEEFKDYVVSHSQANLYASHLSILQDITDM